MELIKESLRFASIKEVVNRLYEEFDIYSVISRIGQYYANAHKLETILSFAENMDVLGYSIKDFVKYIDDLLNLDQDIDFSDKESQEDSVTLINIHGSKGLEYRIVYYPGLDVQFNRMDTKSSFLISDKYGLVSADIVDNQKVSALLHLAKEETIKADFEEKIRLLYVALTRAKEKIILVSGSADKPNIAKYPLSSTTMNDLLKLTNVLTKYQVAFSLDERIEKKSSEEQKVKKVELRSVSVPATLVKKQRASKNVDDASLQVLDFGTEVHAYLENMDLDNDDLSYITNSRMRKIVSTVKNSSLFKDITNDMVRHEYPFYDKETNVSGVIDALIIKDDEIDIVDFKLKHIDDEEYDRQLRLYRDYIYKITDKKIKMYLLSMLTGEIKEVI